MTKQKEIEQLEKELIKLKMEVMKSTIKLVLTVIALFIVLHLIDVYLGRTAFWIVLLLVIFANIHSVDKYKVK